jgi:hypothetical protein
MYSSLRAIAGIALLLTFSLSRPKPNVDVHAQKRSVVRHHSNTGQQRGPYTEFQQGRCPTNRSLTPATWGRMGRTSVIFNSRRGLVKFGEVVSRQLPTPWEYLPRR